MARKRRTVPWLERRGDKFYAFWYDPAKRERKRKSLGTSDPEVARNRFAAFLQTDLDAEPVRDARLTVEDALEQYLREHVGPNVADKQRQIDAAKHLSAFFSGMAISDIDIPATRRYAEQRRAGAIGGGKRRRDGKDADGNPINRKALRQGSNSTIRRELVVLAAAANHAKRWRRIDTLPSIEMPKVRIRSHDDEAPFLTKKEFDALRATAERLAKETDGKSLNAPTNENLAIEARTARELCWFIDLAYYTGARRGSIENLERSQVRIDDKRILLQKEDKHATKKRQPIVPIFPEMEPPLRALLGRHDKARLFLTADFYRQFRSTCLAAGIKDRTHPHVLRHSRATHLLQDGASIYAVARLLGDTVATVERVYGHHSPDYLSGEITGLQTGQRAEDIAKNVGDSGQSAAPEADGDQGKSAT